MIENINFRRLGPGDYKSMYELERVCFTLPWTCEQCKNALAQKAFAAFGLWKDSHLAAYLSLYHGGKEMEILNVAVEPSERRKGYARHLLAIVLQVAYKMGMQKASLEVRESNAQAIALYEQAGFSFAGRRRRYYPDTGEDALIYIRGMDLSKPFSQ